MSTRLVHLVIDSADPARLAAFWARALHWEVAADEPDEAVIWPAGFQYPSPAAVPLVFVPVAEPKTGKNRVHLDLATTSEADQAALVERLLGLGATRADVGQRQVPWEVLADPEGNEFCVLEPRPVYQDTGPIAAVVIECADPQAQATFWGGAAGWTVLESSGNITPLRAAAGTGPFLELLLVPGTKSGKNRLHVDVAPPSGGNSREEALRLRDAGAVPVDVGQGEVAWVVLADPEGNEFCVLSPR